MTARLRPDEFAPFFAAVNRGRAPFRWQARLARRILAGTGWPDVLHVPTGAGKSAVVDIALFAAAIDAERPPESRTAPRRVVFVVDRRIVVAQVTDRARAIRSVLRDPGSADVVLRVADRLRSLGTGEPLEVLEWRGGIPRERGAVLHPLQPAVLVSTVDQVGSRLLFRGYGSSDGMLPVHAGLLSQDALLVLDEAHLSAAFEQTLEGIRCYRKRPWAASAVERPWHVVRMSATPRPPSAGVPDSHSFVLDDDDRADPALAPRLRARKPARLAECGSASDASRTSIDEGIAAEARALLRSDDDVRVLGVVVNRVASARAVAASLRTDDPEGRDVVVLTGRVRPHDRERLLQGCWDRIRAGRDRAIAGSRRTVIVATQAIEVGADLDFDGLVTEACSIDALAQRLGRVDRLGVRGSSPVRVLAAKSDIGRSADDPVYGGALASTWRWLRGLEDRRSGVELGVEALRESTPPGGELRTLLPPLPPVPVLLPSHLDAWVQTGPRPAVGQDPDPELFLHGQRDVAPDLLVIWRADLGDDETRWHDRVASCPPTAREALPLPIAAVRRWLRREVAGARPDDLTDTSASREGDETRDAPDGLRCLVWRGAHHELTRPAFGAELRPGDTIVVPSRRGGLDADGWAPDSGSEVEDVADDVEGGRFRLHPDLIPAWLGGAADASERVAPLRNLLSDLCDQDRPPRRAEVERVLKELAAREDLSIGSLARSIVSSGAWSFRPYADFSGVVVESADPEATADVPDDDDASSLLGEGGEVLLADHGDGVGRKAADLATAAGLPGELVTALRDAGTLHDIGKCDPRFQKMLRRGDPLAVDGPCLAKSGIDPRDRRAFRVARERSGLPPGWRHEALSLAMASTYDGLADRDLVLHLVAAHHGHARPFLPPVEDIEDEDVLLIVGDSRYAAPRGSVATLARIDGGVAERFWRLVRSYGWWGLAYLEAILRTADALRSSDERRALARRNVAASRS